MMSSNVLSNLHAYVILPKYHNSHFGYASEHFTEKETEVLKIK